ncbi:MAG: MFS transporter [Saprospiraceae bacterium]|nr:MFS transporter [Saprospiraceae bacterium]
MKDAYAALRIPAYRRFLSMRLTMTLAIQIMSVSVGYFVYEITGDPLMLGFIGLVEAIPAICISLYAGHLADKLNRRNILVACVSVMLLCAVSLLIITINRYELSQTHLLIGMYSVIFFTGIARGFFSPTNFAFLPQLVPKEILPNAITWNSSTWQVASVTGLGIGGLLYGFAGVSATFTVMVCLCVVALIIVLTIAPRPLPVTDFSESALVRIKAGLKFVFSNQLIVSAIALDLFAVLFGGAVALLPVFAKDILHVGPQGLGILRAAMSVGAITTAFFLAHYPLHKGAGKIMLACVAGFGLCMIGFGLSRIFWLSFFFLFLAGVFDEVSVFLRSSLVQFQTPDHMKGRVSSVNSIFITSSNEIGAFESGLAARFLGTVPAVLFGGLMTLLVVGVTWWKAPKLRKLNFDHSGAEEIAEQPAPPMREEETPIDEFMVRKKIKDGNNLTS